MKPRRSVVILPRDAHKSAVHALVLSGATPCFLPPLRHPESGVSLGIGKEALEKALKDHGDEVRRRNHGHDVRGEGAGGEEGRVQRASKFNDQPRFFEGREAFYLRRRSARRLEAFSCW